MSFVNTTYFYIFSKKNFGTIKNDNIHKQLNTFLKLSPILYFEKRLQTLFSPPRRQKYETAKTHTYRLTIPVSVKALMTIR